MSKTYEWLIKDGYTEKQAREITYDHEECGIPLENLLDYNN